MKRLMDERSSIYNSLNQADETLEYVLLKYKYLNHDENTIMIIVNIIIAFTIITKILSFNLQSIPAASLAHVSLVR